MSNALRKIIMQQLSHTNAGISNLIYNSIQNDMEYNPATDKFEIELESLRTEYFKKHPNKKAGIIEGTNINWNIAFGKFQVWMEI